MYKLVHFKISKIENPKYLYICRFIANRELIMHLLRITLLFLLIFLRCNAPESISSGFNLEIPEEVTIPAPLPEEQIARIDSLVNGVLDKFRFNGNVLIAYHGYPLVRSTRGYAHLFSKVPNNYETAFQLASVSKAFTAMAVLILQERGQLNIDDSVKKYIPEFPSGKVTIKHLLQHTSGLPNYMYYVDNQWDKEKHLTYDDVLELLIKNNPDMNLMPGNWHHYSNTGYALLAMLVERVSKLPFHQFARQQIFEPLGMNHTFIWNKETFDTITNIATGFKRYGRRYAAVGHDPLDEIGGDKSVYSTIDDLLKWDRALYTNKLVSESSLQLAFAKTVTRRNRQYDYGLGWRLTQVDDKQVIYHNGLWNGFTSSLFRYVEDSITVIVLNNVNTQVAAISKQLYITVKDEILKNSISDKPSTELATVND